MGFKDDPILKKVAQITGKPVTVPPPEPEPGPPPVYVSRGSSAVSSGVSSGVQKDPYSTRPPQGGTKPFKETEDIPKPKETMFPEIEPGKEVIVEWETKTGDVKTTATTDPDKVVTEISEEHGGQATAIYERPITGGKGRKTYDITYEEPKSILPPSIEREYVTKSVALATKRKAEWEQKWSDVEYVKKHGYRYDMFGTYPSVEEFKKQSFFPGMTLAYEKSGKAGQPIKWSDLKTDEPALELRKKDKGFETYKDITGWREREHERAMRDWDIGYLAGTTLAEVFNPSRWEYAWQSLVGPTEPGWKGWKQYERKQEETLAGGVYEYSKAYEKGDWGKIGIMGISSPMGLALTTYGMGAGIGALKMSAVGSKPLLVSRGTWATTRTIAGKTITTAGQPLYTVTGAKLLEGGIASYAIAETGRGLKTSYETAGISGLKKGAFHLGMALPVAMVSYRMGHTRGMGWMQRRGAMSKVSGLDRVRQQGLYEAMDEVYKMGEPRFKVGTYDITRIQRIDPRTASQVWTYLLSEKHRLFFSGHPRIGGSASTHMQLPEGWFRTDTLPKGLRDWAISRQASSTAGYRPLIGKQLPGDIDLLVLGRGMKRAAPLPIPHKIDIHIYKPGQYYWGGLKQLKSTKSYIKSPFGIEKISTLPLREQFTRKTVSILPSETPITGYRSYKDIPDWSDLADVFYLGSGSKKLGIAIEKVVSPERFPIPRRTMGEYLLKDIKMVEPSIKTTPTGEIYYSYPSYVTTPGYYLPLGLAGYGMGYKTKPYTYKAGAYKFSPYKTRLISTPIITKKPVKPVFEPLYFDYGYKTKPTPTKIPPYTPVKTPMLPPPTTPPIKVSKKEKRRRKLPSEETGKTRILGLDSILRIKPRYKFRRFKSSSYKYKSPFKNRRSIF